MHKKTFDLLIKFLEYEKIIEKMHKDRLGSILDDYTYSEMHCIDNIGQLECPNVTKISKQMEMTKGGISKIISKLQKKGLIETYNNGENKKEKYFKLTLEGQKIFDAHKKLHQAWYNKEIQYFKNFKAEELQIVNKIITELNKYLEEEIRGTNA